MVVSHITVPYTIQVTVFCKEVTSHILYQKQPITLFKFNLTYLYFQESATKAAIDESQRRTKDLAAHQEQVKSLQNWMKETEAMASLPADKIEATAKMTQEQQDVKKVFEIFLPLV